jgi:NAD(P)-dependent dehydrogenase (short-subunit alcohol dehydrogenase family)
MQTEHSSSIGKSTAATRRETVGALLALGAAAATPVAVAQSGSDARPDQDATRSSRRFTGKVVLIFGGTSGIGEATARAFATEGAKVVFTGRRESVGRPLEQSIRDAGGEATYMDSDVRDAKQVRDAVAAAVSKYGRLDVAFLNAGIDKPPQAIVDTDIEAFDEQIAINLRGVFLGMKYTLPHLVASRGAMIVTSSIGGRHAFANIIGYGASKAAVIHMVRTATQEYGRDVRINAIAPGPIETAMLARVRDQWGVSSEQLASSYPAKRAGTPAEVAEVVLWLASSQASYVSGQVIGIDGGGLP